MLERCPHVFTVLLRPAVRPVSVRSVAGRVASAGVAGGVGGRSAGGASVGRVSRSRRLCGRVRRPAGVAWAAGAVSGLWCGAGTGWRNSLYNVSICISESPRGALRASTGSACSCRALAAERETAIHGPRGAHHPATGGGAGTTLGLSRGGPAALGASRCLSPLSALRFGCRAADRTPRRTRTARDAQAM